MENSRYSKEVVDEAKGQHEERRKVETEKEDERISQQLLYKDAKKEAETSNRKGKGIKIDD